MTEQERELLDNYESWLIWLKSPWGVHIKRLRQQIGRSRGGRTSRPGTVLNLPTVQTVRPWEEMGVSRATYYRRKRVERNEIEASHG